MIKNGPTINDKPSAPQEAIADGVAIRRYAEYLRGVDAMLPF